MQTKLCAHTFRTLTQDVRSSSHFTFSVWDPLYEFQNILFSSIQNIKCSHCAKAHHSRVCKDVPFASTKTDMPEGICALYRQDLTIFKDRSGLTVATLQRWLSGQESTANTTVVRPNVDGEQPWCVTTKGETSTRAYPTGYHVPWRVPEPRCMLARARSFWATLALGNQNLWSKKWVR